MAVLLKLACPDCAHRFSMRMEDDGKLPSFCPACGHRMESDDPDFVPNQMNIGTALGKSGDQTFRMIEESSIRRAEMAGDPSLKVTNIRDNLREGDVAAMPVNNIVSQVADQAHQQLGFNYFQASVGEELAAVKMGPERGTGMPALEAIQGGQLPSAPRAASVAGMKAGWR